MENAIYEFIEYLHISKHASDNTVISYERDLRKLMRYLTETLHILRWEDVSAEHLDSYVKTLEKEGFAASSVSRSVASIRNFFGFLVTENRMDVNPAANIRPPKAEKKAPAILSIEEVSALLAQPDTKTGKGIRDRAMLELLYATGIRVSELINLRLEDINLHLDYIVCQNRTRERMIPFGSAARKALGAWLDGTRDSFIHGEDSGFLFTNIQGKQMSRQGFWKILKGYASSAGIESDVTPHTLRHSFAVHMLDNGADIYSVQEMMGHTDVSAMRMYNSIRRVYESAHPRS